MNWSEVERDSFGCRFYADFDERLDNLADLIALMVQELDKISLDESINTFNVHLLIEAGLIYFFPCKSTSIEEEEKVQFCIQFLELMDAYDEICTGDYEDSEIDKKISVLTKTYLEKIKSCSLDKKISLNIIYTDMEFSIIG